MTDVDFLSNEEREYFIRAQLGDDVHDFLVSPVGRYLHQRAKIEYEDAKEQLAHHDLNTPEGVAAARALQQKAQLGHAFMRYLADAIQDGNVAHKQLEEVAETGD